VFSASSTEIMSSTFEVLLEKRSRGRILSLSRSWAIRTIRLSKQTLSYYDGNELKGSVDISGCSLRCVSPSEADNKTYPFEVDTGNEKLLFNASCLETRNKCVEIFTLASKSVNWDEVQENAMKKAMNDRESLYNRNTVSSPFVSGNSSASSSSSDGFVNYDERTNEKMKRLEEKAEQFEIEKRKFEKEKAEILKEKLEVDKVEAAARRNKVIIVLLVFFLSF
jgi:hypothetical protein